MSPEVYLSCSQKPTTRPGTKPQESSEGYDKGKAVTAGL